MLPVEVGLEVEAGLGGEAGVKFECLVDIGSVHLAAQLLYEIDAVDVGGVGAGGVGELAVLVEARGVVDASREVPVAIDIVGRDGAHTCLGVVGVAHGEAVRIDVSTDISIEQSLLLHPAFKPDSHVMRMCILEVWVAKHDIQRITVIAIVHEIAEVVDTCAHTIL